MTTTTNIEQWDLTSKVSPYLDRHMMFPLLEYLDTLINAGTVSYSSKDVAAARLALLRPTHMVDYAIDIYRAVHGEGAEIPKEMEEGKTSVYKRLEELEKGCKSMHELCAKTDEKVSSSHVGMFSVIASLENDSHIFEMVSCLNRPNCWLAVSGMSLLSPQLRHTISPQMSSRPTVNMPSTILIVETTKPPATCWNTTFPSLPMPPPLLPARTTKS